MRRLVVLPLASALTLLPAVALATPTVTVAPTIQRFNADGSVAPTRNITVGGTLAQAINFDDCNNDTYITFAVSTAGFDGTSSLQAWAGPSDCTAAASRLAATAVCWQVFNGNLPTTVTQTPRINVRDIVSQIGLSSTQLNLNYVPAGPAVCKGSAGSAISSVAVYFIWVPSGGGDGVSASLPFKVKLAGPAAPTGVGVSAGDTLLKVSWTAPIDPTLAGFDLYTDPPIGGTTSTGVCGSSVLGTGQPPSGLSQYLVPTTAGPTSSSLDVTGLTNGTIYNVAVASTDNFGNVGPLSTTTCGTPARGTAGGGCAAGNLGAAGRAPLLGLSVLGLLGLYLKRRRK